MPHAWSLRFWIGAPMKVDVLTTCSRKSGGLFYSVRGLSKSLITDGVRPTVYSPQDEHASEDSALWNPVPVELYNAYGPLEWSLKLRRMLLGSDADLIHVHGIWLDSQWAALQVQKKMGTPVVVSPRGMLDPWAFKNRAWKKKMVGKLFAEEALHRATCIHVLCRSELESIRALGLTNPTALIPNGVELPELKSREPRSGKKKLLFLGRIHPKKGLSELLQGWADREGSWHEGWELVIAGWDDGGHDDGLKKEAEELGYSVSFIGSYYGEQKEQLLREVNAFILPSFSEGLPMSVLEAMSYGLPVLMTEHCNIPEGFEAGAAIQIKPEAGSIAEGLHTMQAMSDVELEAMGGNGRKLVEQKFTWPEIGRQMLLVYEWCLTGKNPPACMEF
jgi:poly(glycerol-phosphate) alpha-glucosyltransferase